ncbi:GDSL-type esterase/lipase family protein [Mesobacillus subterraneus]|uniref:GDSL-type esterase/lipase family protein n=1 Tax=Mesobacillus subterraneus TaxID=285983 RepID=UPI001CFD9900|nr:GDSL-type esterase/lipase family protein [Mesobacillus subterraneus]WLR53750.1 GDSL-type esterase/lipase family protein [Mesobacillus subterraneus]
MKKKTILISSLILIIVVSMAAFSVVNTQKEEGDRLVIAFGDSLTYGYGDKKGSGYIDTLQSMLNKGNKKDFNFDNEAIYGLESSGILTQLSDVTIRGKLDEADYFILYIGTNDLINSNGENLKNLKHGQIEKGQAEYLKNLKAILNILTDKNEKAPILLLGLYNPYPDSAAIEAIINDWNKEIIKAAKKEKLVSYIPTNDLFKGKDKQKYFSDSLHLNDKGYQLIADRILEKYKFE